MSTLQEIKTAIAQLPPHERALLTAELLAAEPEPDTQELEAALERGMADVATGRVRPISEVPALIRGWLGKS
jgi:predicted transcriptional regulator